MKSEKMAHAQKLHIGIIGAMDEEIETLKASITNLSEETHMGFSFFSGELNNKSVTLLKSGIGKVNAAIGTTLLIEKFTPTHIINTGSAGGFDTDLEVGDVVVSTDVFYHDVDVTAFGYAPGQMAGMPKTYTPDASLITIAETHLNKLDNIQTVKGQIASGDVFMADPARVDAVKTTFPDVKAVEMEAAAIAHTCHVAGVPFIVFRSISDIPGKEGNNLTFEEFVKIAGKHSAHMVMEMVAHIERSPE